MRRRIRSSCELGCVSRPRSRKHCRNGTSAARAGGGSGRRGRPRPTAARLEDGDISGGDGRRGRAGRTSEAGVRAGIEQRSAPKDSEIRRPLLQPPRPPQRPESSIAAATTTITTQGNQGSPRSSRSYRSTRTPVCADLALSNPRASLAAAQGRRRRGQRGSARGDRRAKGPPRSADSGRASRAPSRLAGARPCGRPSLSPPPPATAAASAPTTAGPYRAGATEVQAGSRSRPGAAAIVPQATARRRKGRGGGGGGFQER